MVLQMKRIEVNDQFRIARYRNTMDTEHVCGIRVGISWTFQRVVYDGTTILQMKESFQ